MKHILAVYDVDPVYAARFAEVVNQKEKIPFEVVAFSSIERLRAFAAEYPVKLLLLGACSGGRKGVYPGGKGHSFIEDLDVPTPRAIYSDIKEGECGYQRGHMCPAGDNKWSYKAQKESFLMTNICPQNGDLNQYDWKYLEEACREWAKKFGKIYIVAGPIYYSNKYRTVGENRIAVPEAFFKVVLTIGKEKSQTQAIGFIYDNISGHNPLSYYARPVDYIEEITKLDFFYQLNDEIENLIEEQYDLTYWK